jgi:hypothetical protein
MSLSVVCWQRPGSDRESRAASRGSALISVLILSHFGFNLALFSLAVELHPVRPSWRPAVWSEILFPRYRWAPH